MAITDNIIFRLKAESGQASPSSVVGAGETLTGGTAALVDLGGGVFAWKFTGAESLVTIPSETVLTGTDGGGVTIAVRMKRVAAPTVGSQIIVGWTNAGNTAGIRVLRNSSDSTRFTFSSLFGSSSAISNPSAISTSVVQTYVVRLDARAASLSDVTRVWLETTGRAGTSPDLSGASDNLTEQTLNTIRVNPTNGGDYQIVDLVLWGRELTDTEASAVADNLRGTIDSASGGSASGSVASASLTAPAGSATGTSPNGSASGSFGAVTLTAPNGTATGSTLNGSASGSVSAVSLTAATGSASGTTSGAGTITLGPLKNNTGTVLASLTGITVHVYQTSGALVVTKTGQTTNGSGTLVVSDAAIAAATEYRCVIVLGTGAEGMDKATAA